MGNIGFAYVKEGLGELKRQIKFEIVSAESGALTLGMGIMEEDQVTAYLFSKKTPVI